MPAALGQTVAGGTVEWAVPTGTLKRGTTTVELAGLTSKHAAKATLEVTA
ncbi:hypothetical protein AB0K00_20160 [Dactylosporangium sp. NPDC049525]